MSIAPQIEHHATSYSQPSQRYIWRQGAEQAWDGMLDALIVLIVLIARRETAPAACEEGAQPTAHPCHAFPDTRLSGLLAPLASRSGTNAATSSAMPVT
jgi:hypothetical protein